MKVLEEEAKRAEAKAEDDARQGLVKIDDDDDEEEKEEKDEKEMKAGQARLRRSTACKTAASPKRKGTKQVRKKTPQKTPKKVAPKETDTAKGDVPAKAALTPKSKKKKWQQKSQDYERFCAYCILMF